MINETGDSLWTPKVSLMLGKSSKFLSLTLYKNNNLNPHVVAICHNYRWFKGFNEKTTLKRKFSHDIFPSFTFPYQTVKQLKHVHCSESNNFSISQNISNIPGFGFCLFSFGLVCFFSQKSFCSYSVKFSGKYLLFSNWPRDWSQKSKGTWSVAAPGSH